MSHENDNSIRISMLRTQIMLEKSPHLRGYTQNRNSPHYWFNKWIKFQQYLGLTYCGSSGFKKKISKTKRSLLIGYDLLTALATVSYFFFYFTIKGHTILESTSSKIIIKTLVKFVSKAAEFQYLTFKLLLLFYGDQILKNICSFYCPPRNGFKIILKIIFTAMIYTCIQTFFISIILGVFRDLHDLTSYLSLGLFIVICLNTGIIFSSIMVLILYFSNIVSIEIEEICSKIETGTIKLSSVSRHMLSIKDKMNEMNKYLGIQILLKIIINGIKLSTFGCLIAERMANQSPTSLLDYIAIFTLVFNNLFEIHIICTSSQRIINSTKKLCSQIEWKMVSSPLTQEDLQNVKVILGMRKKIRFTAMDFFGLKSATILTLLSYVGSYALILIQTT